MRGTHTPDESRAAEVVGRQCGKNLSGLLYAEETSGVDFTGDRAGRTVSLGVTSFTDKGLRRDWAVANRARGEDRVMMTSQSWFVYFDGHPRYKDLEKRLEVPLERWSDSAWIGTTHP